MFDAVIIGSGPNGLAAGIALAQEGLSVKIFEGAQTIGGGTRTKELTLPGFKHDVCSAIHPMAASSPFFKMLPLEKYGLEWIFPEYSLAHPLEDEPAVILQKSIDETAAGLLIDSAAYRNLVTLFIERWNDLSDDILGPFQLKPFHPFLLSRFGMKALQPAERLANHQFSTKRAKALFAGLAAHSFLALDQPTTSAIGLVLGIASHKAGWPVAKGGSQQIAEALAQYFKSLGGEIETGTKVESLNELPESKVILFNNTPAQILAIAGKKIPEFYARKLKAYQYGAAAFKIDLALDGPIPWRDERCGQAGTVHLGGAFEEIARSEKKVSQGLHPKKPFVLLSQPAMFDQTRAPEGKHIVWAYCHVPNGSTTDMSEAIFRQIERYAPGFRDRIIATNCMNTNNLENYNPNYVGGDINGGKMDLKQLFTRPVGLFDPYHIPETNFFICSASTPPGGGVHGMSGYHAAQSVRKYLS